MKHEVHVDVYIHNGDSTKLDTISKQLDELILLHGGEQKLAKAGDKLQSKTEALATALKDSKQKEK